jgi:hypothetical protein
MYHPQTQRMKFIRRRHDKGKWEEKNQKEVVSLVWFIILLWDLSVNADINRSPYIHLDLEQNITEHDAFLKL